MPKQTTPLNDTQIKNAKAADDEYSLHDPRGLYLRIRPDGSKDWMLRYKDLYSSKRPKISLGSYNSGTTLKLAREERDKCLALLAKNIDPKSHRIAEDLERRSSNTNTLELVAAKWFEVKKTKITEDFAKDVWRSLASHIFPKLGSYPITQIDAPIVIEVINPVAARGNLETVKRLCQRLNEIMTFAVNSGIIHHNPLSGIREGFATL
jgi:hypothetical protein